MTRREINQYNMQERLATFLNDNLDKIKDKPAIISGVQKLSEFNFKIYAMTHTHRVPSNDGAGTIQRLFHGSRVLINDYLDLLMQPYNTTHPQFYSEYQNARTIIDDSVAFAMDAVAI